MIALTLTFETITPFFGNRIVTIIGKDLSEIATKIDRKFCSKTELQVMGTKARLNVNHYEYDATAVIATFIDYDSTATLSTYIIE